MPTEVLDSASLSNDAEGSRSLSQSINTVVLQPTSLCNLDCFYCYLPERHLKHLMSLEVAERVAGSISDSQFSAEVVSVLWHGGEPLTLGCERMSALLDVFEPLRLAGRIRHSVQTNATLVNAEWCDVFKRYGFVVGVSCDGPSAVHNAARIDWRGRSAWDRIERGIQTLVDEDVPFSCIAVIRRGFKANPGEMLDYFQALGCTRIGFNFEEREGVNTNVDVPTYDEAFEFWRAVREWLTAGPRTLRVRDVDRFLEYSHSVLHPGARRFERWVDDAMPTVSWNGDVVLLSPELAGFKDASYDDFYAGNVFQDSLEEILRDAERLKYVSDFQRGTTTCKAACSYYDFCRGAQAANRFFEHGSFAVGETNYCRVSKQALVDGILDDERGRDEVCA